MAKRKLEVTPLTQKQHCIRGEFTNQNDVRNPRQIIFLNVCFANGNLKQDKGLLCKWSVNKRLVDFKVLPFARVSSDHILYTTGKFISKTESQFQRLCLTFAFIHI